MCLTDENGSGPRPPLQDVLCREAGEDVGSISSPNWMEEERVDARMGVGGQKSERTEVNKSQRKISNNQIDAGAD